MPKTGPKSHWFSRAEGLIKIHPERIPAPLLCGTCHSTSLVGTRQRSYEEEDIDWGSILLPPSTCQVDTEICKEVGKKPSPPNLHPLPPERRRLEKHVDSVKQQQLQGLTAP